MYNKISISNLPSFAENFPAFFRLIYYYFMKNRPIQTAFAGFVENIKNFLTANQKLKMAKYRVNHYQYRLNQMENLIDQNNPHNLDAGSILNQLR